LNFSSRKLMEAGNNALYIWLMIIAYMFLWHKWVTKRKPQLTHHDLRRNLCPGSLHKVIRICIPQLALWSYSEYCRWRTENDKRHERIWKLVLHCALKKTDMLPRIYIKNVRFMIQWSCNNISWQHNQNTTKRCLVKGLK
jgi:hypothetical protein